MDGEEVFGEIIRYDFWLIIQFLKYGIYYKHLLKKNYIIPQITILLFKFIKFVSMQSPDKNKYQLIADVW